MRTPPSSVPFVATLRFKTLAMVLLTTIALIGAICIPLRAVILARFAHLEENLARRDLDRVRNTINDQIEALHAQARDYGVWDDTYAFVAGERPDYVSVNFVDTTFAQNRFGLVVITDAHGHAVYSQGFDLAHRVARPAPEPSVLFPTADDLLYAHLHPERHDIQGLVSTPAGPMMVAAHPILTSQEQGPARGTMLLGRALDRDEIVRLAHTLRLYITISPVNGPFASPDVRDALPHVRASDATFVHALDERTLATYALLRDVRGAPCAVLRVTIPRTFYAQGRADARFVVLSVGAASLLFGLVVLLLVQWLVVRRVTRLGRDVSVVGAQADHSLRVTVTGRDELAQLATDVNTMLSSLEKLQQMVEVEREKAERLLRNILPNSIAARLKDRHETIADSFPEVSVLFADIVGFTDLSSRVQPAELVVMLNEIFSRFDSLAEKHGLEKIKTIGDAYMVVAGLPEHRDDHAEAIASMGLDMQGALDEFNEAHGTELAIRIGINTGPVVAGVIGKKKFIYDLWGDAVNIASRMESSGVAGRVQVSESTWQLLQGKFGFEDRGLIKVKGKGEMRTFLLVRNT
jgi:class 3 adenylate cyclase